MNDFPLPADLSTIYDLASVSNVTSHRESSYDRSGGNIDFRRIGPGQTLTILDAQGAGVVTHLWFALAATDYNYLRAAVLRAYWDNEDQPSVLCPLGDFFGVGHAIAHRWQSLAMGMVRGAGQRGEETGVNCYLPMPFRKAARIELVNESAFTFTACYYMVDYLMMPEAKLDGAGYFHPGWRCAKPVRSVPPIAQSGTVLGRFGANLTGDQNFLVADIEGEGRFIGMNYSVDNIDRTPHGQPLHPFGEGDEMIFIDDEPWPPRLHGTGTEDYFLDAWGMTGNANAYAGTSYLRHQNPDQRGRGTCYRFHLPDPVLFKSRLRFTFEHGHCNCQANDLSATAYWYQHEPHAPMALPDLATRTPRPMEDEPDPEDEQEVVRILDRLSCSFYDLFIHGDRQQVETLDTAPESVLSRVHKLRRGFQNGEIGVDQVHEQAEPLLDWFAHKFTDADRQRFREQSEIAV